MLTRASDPTLTSSTTVGRHIAIAHTSVQRLLATAGVACDASRFLFKTMAVACPHTAGVEQAYRHCSYYYCCHWSLTCSMSRLAYLVRVRQRAKEPDLEVLANRLICRLDRELASLPREFECQPRSCLIRMPYTADSLLFLLAYTSSLADQ